MQLKFRARMEYSCANLTKTKKKFENINKSSTLDTFLTESIFKIIECL